MNFAGSLIPNFIDDGGVFNALRLLCHAVPEPDGTQVPQQPKLKVTDAVWSTLKPWRNSSRI